MKKLVITLTALFALGMGAWAESSQHKGAMNLEGILLWKLPAGGGTMTIYGDEYQPMMNYTSAADNRRHFATSEVGPKVKSIDMQKGFNVGNYAFSQLDSLESVTLHGTPSDVRYFPIFHIGDYAFAGSSKLASINSNNLTDLRYIGTNAFAGTAIKTFTINKPAGRELPYYAKQEGGFLVDLNREHCYIGENAFNSQCLNTVYMKDDTPFSDTYNNFLNDYAFLVVDNADVAATYRTAWSEIASRIVYLEETVPFANEEMKNICVNNWDTNGDGELSYEEIFAVTDFGDAFAGNTTITKIDGLEPFVNVTVIGSGTFGGCTALESITIPSHITDIADDAFTGCTNLKEIHFVNKTPFKDSFTIQTNERTHIIVPDDAVGTYEAWWTDKSELIIGESHIPFQCPLTKQICVTNWDKNKDGELSYTEAAQVTYIDTKFQSKSITSFNEFRYFTGLKTIANSAFYQCKNLTDIYFSENLTSIGKSAFKECSSLISVNFPENSRLTSIGDEVFRSCTKLTEINLPESLTSIGNSAFNTCTELTEINLPESLTSIGGGAFYYCTKLTEINIPENVNKIGISAFSYIAVPVIFKNPSPIITYQTFSNIPLYIVPDEAVEAYRVAWPDAKLYITSKSALDWKEVTCEAQPTSSHLAELIGVGNELDVVKLRIRGTINSYDMMVMRNKMPNLRELDLTNATIVANSYNYGTGVSEENVFPDFMTGKPLTNILLPESITRIGGQAFENCRYFEEITIPDNVRIIGNKVFRQCTKLRAINVSGSSKLQSIDKCAFQDAFSLDSVDFSQVQQLKSIGDYAFSNSNIRSISLPTSLESIGSYAFEGVDFQSFTTTANISSYAFEKCLALKTVTIQEGVSTIKSYAFNGCTALTSITIPDSVTSLGTYAFNGCTALEKAEIGMGITSVPQYLFNGCTALKEVKLSPKTTTIQSYAFQNCTGLTEIHLPPYLTSIQSDAFKGCSNLKEIYAYMPDVPAIAASTFSNYSTSTLYAPAFLFNAYYYDSGWNQFLNVLRCDLRPGDYEAFYTNKDLYFKEGEERITHDRPIVELGNQGSIIVEGAEQEFTTVDMLRGETSSSLIGNDNISMDELRVKINVIANRWYFLCFPYDVTISECTYPGKYAWRYYDGAARAANGNGGWQKIQGDVLKAGVGYIFQSNTAGNLIVKFAKPEFGGDRPTALQAHGSTNAANASWNFVGNPYACYYNLVSDDFASPITVWNGSTYVAYRPGDDNYHLQPYEAFFVQKTENASAINFSAEGRETYSQSVATAAAQTRASFQRSITNNRFIVNLTISDNDTAAIDRTRLVMNNKASCNYELACDASKFISEDAAAQIYTLEGSVKMAINERPGQGKVRIGYTAQKAGKLRIEAQRMDSPMELLDTKTNRTFDLAQGAYEFTTEAGTFDNRFVICTSRGADEINNLTAATGVVIGMQEGGLNIGGAADKLVAIYGTNGTLVAEQYGNGYVALPSGIYVVKVDGHSAKMYVK